MTDEMTISLPGRLRLIVDGAMDGAGNMAADEAVLAAGEGPTLRLYGWAGPTVSLGYFQPWAGLGDQPAEVRGLPVVRRPTGGGAIVHAEELTYCLVIPGLAGGNPSDLYRLMHEAVASAVERLTGAGKGDRQLFCLTNAVRPVPKSGQGRKVACPLFPCQHVRTNHVSPLPEERWVIGPAGLDPAYKEEASSAHATVPRNPAEPFLCFSRRGRFDLLAGEGKLAGSAQRRTGRGLLQHGSVILRGFPAQPSASVEALAGRVVGFDELAAALVETVRAGGTELTAGELSEREREAMIGLREKHLSESWVRRR